MDDIGKVRRRGRTFQKVDDILLFGSKNSMWAQNVKIVNIVVAQNQNVNMVKDWGEGREDLVLLV